MKRKYVTVRIPVDLADEIDAILCLGIRGYRSRAELIVEATRLRLESLYRNISMRNDMLKVQRKLMEGSSTISKYSDSCNS